MDAYVFDQAEGNQEAIDVAMKRAQQRRKTYQSLLAIMSIAHTIGGLEFDEGLFDESEDL